MSRELAERVMALRDSDKIGTDEYDGAVFALWGALKSAHRDVLRQVLKAPTWAGDICSKSGRNDLIDWGLATPCIVGFEEGFTTATPLAYTIWSAVGARA